MGRNEVEKLGLEWEVKESVSILWVITFYIDLTFIIIMLCFTYLKIGK